MATPDRRHVVYYSGEGAAARPLFAVKVSLGLLVHRQIDLPATFPSSFAKLCPLFASI